MTIKKRKIADKGRSVPMLIGNEESDDFLFRSKSLTPVISIATGIISFLSGIITASVWVTRNVATVPYVEHQLIETDKKIQSASLTALKEAQIYSDTNATKNREIYSKELNDTKLKIESIQGDMKGLSVKQDLTLDALRAIQNQTAGAAAVVATKRR